MHEANMALKKASLMGGVPGYAREMNLIERTRSEIENLETALSRKKELLGLLEKNPVTLRVIELMLGGGY